MTGPARRKRKPAWICRDVVLQHAGLLFIRAAIPSAFPAAHRRGARAGPGAFLEILRANSGAEAVPGRTACARSGSSPCLSLPRPRCTAQVRTCRARVLGECRGIHVLLPAVAVAVAVAMECPVPVRCDCDLPAVAVPAPGRRACSPPGSAGCLPACMRHVRPVRRLDLPDGFCSQDCGLQSQGLRQLGFISIEERFL